MRIGIAALGSSPGKSGGVDIYTQNLVHDLASAGIEHQIVVLPYRDDKDMWLGRNWPENVYVRTVSRTADNLIVRVAFGVLRRFVGSRIPSTAGDAYVAYQIDRLRLDLVHFTNSVVLDSKLQTPAVVTVQDIQHKYFPEFFTHQELSRRTQSFEKSVSTAARILAPSKYTCSSLHECYDVPHGKVSIVGHAAGHEFDANLETERERVRLKYELPDEYIFYPANPWPHKNHARLMAALRTIRQRYGYLPTLVVSGRLSGERQRAADFAIAAGIEDAVVDLGFVPTADLPGLYALASLLVFPSLFEGFGIPLVEAMKTGCPIAASNTTSIPEITGDAALLFDPMDVSAIADAIHRVLVDSELRIRLVNNGHLRAKTFNRDSIINDLLAVYQKVAKG